MTAPTKKYNVFIQRFTEQFHKEIDCPDNEGTLQTLITLMNKCGLRELLDPSPSSTITTTGLLMVPHPSPHSSPHSLTIQGGVATLGQATPGTLVVDTTSNSSAGKKLNGFHIWQKERKQRWIAEGKPGNSPDYHAEWKLFPESVKEEYKAQARVIRGC